MPRGYELNVNSLGKAATWVLYFALFFVLLTERSADWPLWVFWSGVALALAAAAQYLLTAVRGRRT
jgi:phosphatidylglycerophosphate synthase